VRERERERAVSPMYELLVRLGTRLVTITTLTENCVPNDWSLEGEREDIEENCCQRMCTTARD